MYTYKCYGSVDLHDLRAAFILGPLTSLGYAVKPGTDPLPSRQGSRFRLVDGCTGRTGKIKARKSTLTLVLLIPRQCEVER